MSKLYGSFFSASALFALRPKLNSVACAPHQHFLFVACSESFSARTIFYCDKRRSRPFSSSKHTSTAVNSLIRGHQNLPPPTTESTSSTSRPTLSTSILGIKLLSNDVYTFRLSRRLIATFYPSQIQSPQPAPTISLPRTRSQAALL